MKKDKPESMRRNTLLTVFILCCLISTGCATLTVTSSKIPFGGYHVLFSPGDHLAKLVEKGQYQEANQVYERQLDYFAKNPDKHSAALDRLVFALNETYSPKVAKEISEIDAIHWPASPTKWGQIAKIVEEAKDLLNSYETQSILKSREPRFAPIVTLKSKVDKLNKKIMGTAAEVFAAYPLYESPDFFRLYPITLKPTDFLKQHGENLMVRLKISNPKQLQKIYDTYSNYLADSVRNEIANSHYLAVLNDSKKTQQPTFADILYAVKETYSAGMPLTEIPNAKIQLIEVTSQTLLKEGLVEFPVAIDVDLPFATNKSDLDKAFDSPYAKDADILVLLDVSLARTSRNITKKERISSEYHSSTKTEQNPNYNLAQNEVNIAQQQLGSAQREQYSVDNQYCKGYG